MWPPARRAPLGGAGAGRRRPLGVKEAIQTAKGNAGLDQYEVRRYDAWYRHVTLSLLAAAFLAVRSPLTAGQAAAPCAAAPAPSARRRPHFRSDRHHHPS